MSSQQVDERMTQMEERFAEREASMLALMAQSKSEMGRNKEVDSQERVNVQQNVVQQQPPNAMSGEIFRAKMPVFDGKGRWQSYLLQFQTILRMYQCRDEQIMVGNWSRP